MEIPEKWTQYPPCFAITIDVRLRSHTNKLLSLLVKITLDTSIHRYCHKTPFAKRFKDRSPDIESASTQTVFGVSTFEYSLMIGVNLNKIQRNPNLKARVEWARSIIIQIALSKHGAFNTAKIVRLDVLRVIPTGSW